MGERRRFFRIDDEFEVRVLPGNGAPRQAEDVSNEARELGQALGRLRRKLPEAADVIELLARRVAVLEHQGEEPGDFSPAEMVQGTNISGCGIAICSRRQLVPGRMLDLELHLDAGAVRFKAVGRVVSCESLSSRAAGGQLTRQHSPREPAPRQEALRQEAPRQENWLVRIDFVAIEPDDEEALVQYVMRRQLRQLRRGRDADNPRP